MSSEYKWLIVVGLAFDLVGAFVLAYGLFVSKKNAIELSVSRWTPKTDQAKLRLPQVRDRLKQSQNAKIGVGLLMVGFILQIIGSWPC